jgi:two-component system, chemotaxis family, chemotaxis protein CheY
MSIDILIVDDSAIVRAVVRKALGLSGLDVGSVHEAGDGHEALEVLRRAPVDLVLADVNMPSMSGVQLLQRMQAEAALAATPVVIISSDHSDARIDEVRRSGARAYLTKPFRPEQLKRVLEGVLGPVEDRNAR